MMFFDNLDIKEKETGAVAEDLLAVDSEAMWGDMALIEAVQELNTLQDTKSH